jgi:hypothetical protein
MLIGGGHMPVVTADLGEVVDQPVLYLRLAVEDMPRQGPRHEVNLSFSGPPADVVRLVADLAAAVEQAQPPEG